MHSSDEHALDYVDAYLHDALSASSRRRVAAHCRECPICKVALEEAQKRFDLLQSSPPVEAPESLLRATEQRIERFRRRRVTPLRIGIAVAACLLAMLGIASVYYLTLSASAVDLRILGQSELFAGADASLRVLLQDPRGPIALAGVPIDIDLLPGTDRPAIHLASLVTDQFGSGAVHMHLPDWTPGKYALSVRARSGGLGETIVESITLRRSWQLILSSDKPVYRPGETIRLRSLALAQPHHMPVAGQTIEFSVTDANGYVVFRKRDVTSRFGISSTECPLAQEVDEGTYQIQATIGDTASALTVEVRKYVLPKFKIDIALDRPFYQPGQKVRGTVTATYFFGKPVRGGKLEIDVAPIGLSAAGLSPIVDVTDAAGSAKFEFVLPESLDGKTQDSGDARFDLTAQLADAAGQRQTATASAVVTAQPIRIEIVPESGRLIPGLVNKVFFLTSYADGRPAPTRLAISGIDREISTDEQGAASIEFNPSDDSTHWLIRATDDSGKTGRREITLEADRVAEPFLVNTDEAVYDAGQTVHIRAVSAVDTPLFVDVIQDGQTMLTTAIPIAGGRGAYDLDLPPQCVGALQLSTYRLGHGTVPAIQNRVIYVRSASALKIDARLNQNEYRPGGKAKLTVSVTDAKGNPAQAAISLAAVDEAVGSVLGHKSGLSPVLSPFQQQLLKPVVEFDPSLDGLKSSDSAGGRNRFEQAIFARAAADQDKRDAFLQEVLKQYGENDQIALEVLKRPDWEQLVEQMPDMEKYLPILRGQETTYTLRDSSYRAKSRTIEALRTERLNLIAGIWIALAAVTVIAGLIWLCRQLPLLVELLVFVTVVCVLIAMLLPAVQSAREASPSTMARNDLRMIGMALESRAGAYVATAQAAAASLASSPKPRLRTWFPETLLWQPELITDDAGRATLDIDLADSITTWRLSADAVSADGMLGAAQRPIRVFQPFFVDLNLPLNLTRGDEISVPAVVYNYSNKPLSIALALSDATWFERLGPAKQTVDLAVNEVRSVSFRIRAKKIGRFELTVQAAAAGLSDAIRRSVDVSADGRRVEQSKSGTLDQPADIPWTVPAGAIDGSVRATVKIFPSTFSQVVDGMASIFQMPYGCFEQTSSTTYPNVLALDYLRRTHQTDPRIEATAQRDIHLGYQRLLSFEIPTGGFEWFGNPPANQTLTAYGLMEFTDMALVHDVDARLIERTRDWLLQQQQPDGSWLPEDRRMEEDPARAAGDLDRLSTTAYIAWAVYGGRDHESAGKQRTLSYILGWEPQKIDDPYVLALVANALQAIEPDSNDAGPYLDRLEQQCERSDDGKLVWWALQSGRRTTFYGGGNCGAIETTSLATLAMLGGHRDPPMVRSALAWLITQKNPQGTWGSTQATVLALKALLAGTGESLSDGQARKIDVLVDGKPVKSLDIPPEQCDVVQQIDLSKFIAAGNHRLSIHEHSGSACGYDASLVHYVPNGDTDRSSGAFAISLEYDKPKSAVADRIEATARVTNRLPASAPMVVVELPAPPGFSLDTADLDSLQSAGKIAKYQMGPRGATVYLRELATGEPLMIKYHLRAEIPLKVVSAAAWAYEYYDPTREAYSAPVQLEVAAAK
jgi:type II secretory pathway pseudopilin PulG